VRQAATVLSLSFAEKELWRSECCQLQRLKNNCPSSLNSWNWPQCNET